MTALRKPSNPLIVGATGPERGTSASAQRLQDHCDMLNAMGWVQASGDPYVVGMLAGVRQVMRRSQARKPA